MPRRSFDVPLTTSALVAALLLGAPQAAAIDLAPIGDTGRVALTGQLRTRFVRHDGKDGRNDNKGPVYVENRARLGVSITLDNGVGGLIQLQDVRVWGEEKDTLGNVAAEGLDLHQAYADIPLGLDGLKLRIGRQEMGFDEQRLIGSVGWTPQARAFDAALVSFKRSDFMLSADVFYAQTSDLDTILPKTPSEEDADKDISLFTGAIAHLDLLSADNADNTLAIYTLIDRSENADRTRVTLGAHDQGKVGMFRYRVEAYLQTGDLAGQTILAGMVGAYAGVLLEDVGGLELLGWFDYLSGSANPAKAGLHTFDTLFATNHKFYGFADFFLALPKHSEGKGLIDLALKTKAKPLKGLTVILDVHGFLPAEPRGGAAVFGWELDTQLVWKPLPQVGILGGAFIFFPGKGFDARLSGTDPDVGVYLQTQVDL